MDSFPANSRKAQAADEPKDKDLKRVTSAEPSRRKRGVGRKFKETLIGGDTRTATEYVFFNVIIPSARDMLYEAWSSGLERLIYGESARHRRPTPPGYGPTGHVNYQRMGGGPTTPKSSQPRMLSRRSRSRHDFDELIIPSRTEAEDVIDQMFDVLSRYGVVTVADLYELTGIQSSHTDMKWGWTELRGAKAVRLRQGGFLLDLPEPEAFE